MAKTKTDLDAASEAWLDAQAGYKKFLEATETLFAVFAEGWCGPRRAMAEAFDSYRAALLRNAGYSLAEVTKVHTPPAS